jgi:hypothetical protein
MTEGVGEESAEFSRPIDFATRFLEVEDPIDQYLLELYVALELNTSLSEFDTH